jgi:hypothetical protein
MKQTTKANLPKDKVVVYLDPSGQCPHSSRFEKDMKKLPAKIRGMMLVHSSAGANRSMHHQYYPQWFAGKETTRTGHMETGVSIDGLKHATQKPKTKTKPEKPRG